MNWIWLLLFIIVLKSIKALQDKEDQNVNVKSNQKKSLRQQRIPLKKRPIKNLYINGVPSRQPYNYNRFFMNSPIRHISTQNQAIQKRIPNQGISQLIYAPNQFRNAYIIPSQSVQSTSFLKHLHKEDAWSSWSAWSQCSKSCNGGTKTRTRICESFKGQNHVDIAKCEGYSKETQACTKKACLTPKEVKKLKYEERKKQCTKKNKVPYLGEVYKWIPFRRGGLSDCGLYCLADGFKLFRTFGNLEDGTVCGKTDGYVCNKGKCITEKNLKRSKKYKKTKNISLSSNSHIDRTISKSKQKSQNVKWNFVQRVFRHSDHMNMGYNAVFTIPRGAVNVSIAETTASKNYLVLKTGGFFILNGRWQVESNSKTLFAAGTQILYIIEKGEKPKEKLTANGPLSTPLYILILYQNDIIDIAFNYSISYRNIYQYANVSKPLSQHYNHYPAAINNQIPQRNQHVISDNSVAPLPQRNFQQHRNFIRPIPGNGQGKIQQNGQQFQYVISKLDRGKEKVKTTYKWQIGGITRCTKRCGGGEQIFMYRCFEAKGLRMGKFVTDDKCATVPKPLKKMRVCNQHPCPTRWITSKWSACTKTCGRNSTQHRSVSCQKTEYVNNTATETTVNPIACQLQEKPLNFRECNYIPCYFKWNTSEWGQCSTTCDYGFRKRRVFCEHTRKIQIPDENCNMNIKPNVTEKCFLKPCSTAWFTSEWSPCSSACDNGYQTRQVVCANSIGMAVSENFCLKHKPKNKRECFGDVCKDGFWMISKWSKCSSYCGLGKHYRKVLCMVNNDGMFNYVDSKNCLQRKPIEEKSCHNEACSPLWYTDHWTKCSKSCEKGLQNRNLICLSHNGGTTGGCLFHTRPVVSRYCNNMTCPAENLEKNFKNVQDGNSEELLQHKKDAKESKAFENSNSISTRSKNHGATAKSKNPNPTLTNVTSQSTQTFTSSSTLKLAKETSTKAPTTMLSTTESTTRKATTTGEPTTIRKTTATQKLTTTKKPILTQKPTTTRKTTTTPEPTTTQKPTTTKKITTTRKPTTTRKTTTTPEPTTTQKPTTTKKITITRKPTTTKKTFKPRKPSVKRYRTKNPYMNRFRPFAHLSKNACFDFKSQAYCYVIAVRLKFCNVPRLKNYCCKSCKG